MKDLIKVKRRYNRNFKKLLNAVDTLSYRKYGNREKKFYDQEVTIQKDLGLYVVDPCPLCADFSCDNCTGYYKRENKRNVMCGKDDEKADKCILKESNI